MIGKTVSHYRITEKLGGGGMGVVYRAEDTRLKRTVALKFLSPELTRDDHAKQRFVNEAQAASQLDHPNICTIHEIAETDDGQLFLVLSCYDGETVRDRLEKGPMPIDEAIGLALHVARGLEKAHEKNIVHRDMKPANIFLTNDGRAKILDFGLAKLAGQTRLTRAGGTMGTVAYMSPEQARGGELGPQTDIWSLGVVLFEALSGHPPFPGDRPESVLYSVVHEEPGELKELRHDVPARLAAIVSKCLSKDPAERFQTASDLARALEPLRSNRSTGSSIIEIGSTTRIPAEPARRLGLTVAAVVLLVFAGLLAVRPVRDTVRGWMGWGKPTETRLLAVLPFRNAGGSSDDAFVDGLRRHLTSRLSQFEQYDETFRVIPASELDRQLVTTPEKALAVSGATLALEGAVERRGGGVTLWLSLVDTRSSLRSPSQPWEGNLTNVAECQEGPVVLTASMLELADEGPGRQALSAGCTTVPGAWELYLSGLGRLWAVEDDSTDHIADAVTLFNEALALDPSYAQAFVGLGHAYWSLFAATADEENARRAAESARAAVGLDDKLSDAHIVAGLVESRIGSDSLAIRQFTRALEIDPVDPRALRELAGVGLGSDDLVLAERTFKRAVDVRPGHWRAPYDLGTFYYVNGRYEEALRALKRASALAPDHPWPHIVIGCTHFADDEFDQASATWERSLDVAASPKDCRMVYGNLGTCYFVRAQYADAVRMFEMALEEDATNYLTWGNMAAAYDVLPDGEEKAVEHYTRALELGEVELRFDPDDEDLLALLASYSAELGDSSGARAYLGRAMELDPEDESTMFYIGLTHEVLGDRETAIDWVVRALENGYSRVQAETTPGLRGLCSDVDYLSLVQDDSESG